MNNNYIDRPVRTWRKAVKAMAIIIVANLVVFLIICPPCMTTAEGLEKIWDDIVYSMLLTVGLWLGNGYISEKLDEAISWIEQPLKRLIIGLVAMFGYSTLITLIISFGFLYLRYPDFRFNSTWEFFLKVLNIPLIITLAITTFLTSRSFLLNWKRATIEASQAKAQALKFQYDALKSQLNPHFLFNSMNALTNLIYEDQEASVRFVRQLSQVYRYVLDTREQEVVTVAEELEFLRSYIFLQKIRMEDALIVSIDEGIHTTGVIPPMSLQLLVENAVKHNIASKKAPLDIAIYSDQGYMVVKNNQQPKPAEESSAGLGLLALTRRYENLTDKKVEIKDNPDSFTVKIPVLTLDT